MFNNAVPDSWEEVDLSTSTSDLQQKLTKLNVNSVEVHEVMEVKDVDGDQKGDVDDGSDKKSINVDSIGDPLAGDSDLGASSAMLDSWEDRASSTPEDGTAKPIVEDDVDIDVDIELDGDEEKPKPTPKKCVVYDTDVDIIGDPLAGDSALGASSAMLDSWEDGASSTPEDGTVKPIVEDDVDIDVDIDMDGDEEKPKSTPKQVIVQSEPKPKKEHINIVIIGHVDAGKSTIGGQIMALTGVIDKRTLDKYEKEAKESSRESWYLSWVLDTNQEEREKGKTVEVGRAYFETERKHFTILDAPGHKSFVPNMIGGTAQADLAVLVISARKGEFETGFDRGGQTREHAILARTAGVKHMVVLINKMDDPTVLWSKVRYEECRDKILPYLKKLGFNLTKDLTFMPVSGQTGLGIRDQVEESICPWYRGPAFIPFIDNLPLLNRSSDGPFIMPIVEKYKDMGTVLMGKVESGEAKKAQILVLMPNRTQVIVDQLWSDDEEVTSVGPGENIKVKLKGVEEDVSPGFILCDPINPVKTCRIFDGQVVILEHKNIICEGYSAVMHIHCVAEVVEVKALICLVDRKTGLKSNRTPMFVKQDQVVIMRLECAGVVCLEEFKLFPQMGRFTLRDEGKTIAIGKVLKIIK